MRVHYWLRCFAYVFVWDVLGEIELDLMKMFGFGTELNGCPEGEACRFLVAIERNFYFILKIRS
jgi:hypothetical protein